MSQLPISPARQFAGCTELVHSLLGYLGPTEKATLLLVSKLWSELARVSLFTTHIHIANFEETIGVYNRLLTLERGLEVPKKLALAFIDYDDWQASLTLITMMSKNVVHWEVASGPAAIARNVVGLALAKESESHHTLTLRLNPSPSSTFLTGALPLPRYLGLGFPKLRELYIGDGLVLTCTPHSIIPNTVTRLSLGPPPQHSRLKPTSRLTSVYRGLCPTHIISPCVGLTHLHIVVDDLECLAGVLSHVARGLEVLSVVVMGVARIEDTISWIKSHLKTCTRLKTLRMVGVNMGVSGAALAGRTVPGLQCIVLPDEVMSCGTPAADQVLFRDHGGLGLLVCKWHSSGIVGSPLLDLVDWELEAIMGEKGSLVFLPEK